MKDALAEILKKYWGYDSFRPLQREAMEAVMKDRDSLVVMPTGGGKSLCYQVPALAREGMAIVVSPLISLMKDQVDALVESGIEAARLDSSQDADTNRDILRRAARGELKLLYISPERLATEWFTSFFSEHRPSMIAIDEAHCVSMWGHDFRPEYLQLGALREHFPDTAIHAYTATATAQVRADIARQLTLKKPEILVGSFDRPNLFYRVRERRAASKQIDEILQRHKGESAIVYCLRRKDVESTCADLRVRGHSALPYHAGMDDDARKKNQDDFIHDRADIIVATVAFGMGIDKPDVRCVIHAGMPKSLEHYQQESGRAGRDGLPAECWLLYSFEDRRIWEYFIDQMEDAKQAEIAKTKLDAMQGFCTGGACRHRAILEYFEQTLEGEDCQACDICAGETGVHEDSLDIARKILSCVLRLDQRFGADYTAKVLAGSREARIMELRHDRLSTWGILKDSTLRDIRGWIEQLIAQGLLKREGDYKILTITPRGRALLGRAPADTEQVKQAPRLQPAARPAGHAGQSAAGSAAPAGRSPRTGKKPEPSQLLDGREKQLFLRLKQLRLAIASEHGLPAFVVFNDVTLRELARLRPATMDEFRNVIGVGRYKADAYGRKFLDFINAGEESGEGN
jgi:ATP-dependent DNA helicase RecQ